MRHTGLMWLALIIALCSTAIAQSLPGFETAIVRPSGPQSVFQSKLTSSQFIATRHTLQLLIESSYPDLPPWRISGGPPWTKTEQWDLLAKLPAAAPIDQEHLYRATEQMLRNFLAPLFLRGIVLGAKRDVMHRTSAEASEL